MGTGIETRYCTRCGARLASDNADSMCRPCHRATYETAQQPPEVPPGFWDNDQLRDALVRERHIGHAVRSYRKHPYHGQKPISQEAAARWLSVSQTQLSRIENGRPIYDLDRLIQWARVLRIPPGLLWFSLPDEGEDVKRREFLTASSATAAGVLSASAVAPGSALYERLSELRSRADNLLDTQSVSPASLDSWEETADYYGFLELTAEPEAFLAQVGHDFSRVEGLLGQRQSLHTQKRLYHVMGQFGGLIAIVSNDVGWNAQPWFGIARRAAGEAEDNALTAWALTHQSMTYLWSGNFVKALQLSQKAQDISRTSAAGCLASAMEARAQACLGRQKETLAAVSRSDDIYDHLGPDDIRVNVLSVYEHLLRFFQSNALTVIGETERAFDVQEQAFRLDQGNVVDKSLLQMDRAMYFIRSGDPDEGVRIAVHTLNGFELKSRTELINRRAREILRLAPAGDYSSELSALLETKN
jgi:transcriptional regulator with XRE-family HTH domain